MVTQRLSVHFDDYYEDHKTKGNQRTHMIGIPLIMISLLGMLSHVYFGSEEHAAAILRLDGGSLLLLGAAFWYLTLDWKIALPFTLVAFGMYEFGRSLNWPVLIGLQVAGWVSQYVGHYVYEKRSPAFYRNLKHTLIGPLWVFAKMIGYVKLPQPRASSAA